MAQAKAGRFLLRIEDIDSTRSRPEWEAQIYDDLAWLGISWETPAMRQSDRLPAYRDALQSLWQRDLLYPCSCSRRDILAAASAPQEGVEPAYGPDGLIYPGTCRKHASAAAQAMPEDQTLRLNMAKAAQAVFGDDATIGFDESGIFAGAAPTRIQITPEQMISQVGDIVLSRRDFLGSYHLSVVLDDAAQRISHVVRGKDIFDATNIHVVLQQLLGLPTPTYHHHELIRDAAGKRLAKRDDARAIGKYRAEGASPQDIRQMVGL